jgi:hypothetical protein
MHGAGVDVDRSRQLMLGDAEAFTDVSHVAAAQRSPRLSGLDDAITRRCPHKVHFSAKTMTPQRTAQEDEFLPLS